MIKTFKGKISLVYLSLVVTIGVIGIFSVMNLYNLKKSIDGLMTNNYETINAANNMAEALEKQDLIIISNVYSNNQETIDKFYIESNEFFKWYNIELTSLDEDIESQLLNTLGKQYIEYIKGFSELQAYRTHYSLEETISYYNEKVIPVTADIRKTLNELIRHSENSMLLNRDRVTEHAANSMYIILTLSSFAVIAGYILSRYHINKTIKPIQLLTDTMKKVKEGDLKQEAPVISQDEIGILAKEFNNMTKRIYEFEKSTLGKIIHERNKTLAIVKNSSSPLVVLDINYRILLLNNAFEKFFGVKEEEVINRHFLEVVREGEIFEYINSAYEEIDELDQYKEKILNIDRRDKVYYFNTIVTPVSDGAEVDGINGMVVLFQNVTELKEMEQMKTDFVSTVSHEFKTPLTSLMIGASMLMDEDLGKLNQKQKEIMVTINEDLNRLTFLVNDLLKLSKLEYENSIFSKSYCWVKDIVESSIKEFYNIAENKKVHLVYKIDKKLPSIYGDFEKLKWVVNNLISNALKYTNEGDSIHIRAYKAQNKIYISVKDTGIGIPEEYLDRVFEKFVQIPGTPGDEKGSGLGLAIAKQIVNTHNGDIWCDSTLGVGSEFIIAIPVGNMDEEERKDE